MEDLTALLIGGPPGAGKTTLARSVAASLGFLSTIVDDLVATARLVTDAHSHPDLHRADGVGIVDYFTEGPPERLIADAVALEETMWPILEQVIQRRRGEKAPIVMDWWLFNGSRDPEAMHTNFMRRSLWRNELVAERAAAVGLPVLHQPGGKSVENLTDEALHLLG
jgi:hypothetical protein